jgi:exopolysaccharide biosynthesis protein
MKQRYPVGAIHESPLLDNKDNSKTIMLLSHREKMKKIICSVLILFMFVGGWGPYQQLRSQTNENNQELFSLTRIQTDTLFQSRQSISILTIPFESLKSCKLEFGYSDPALLKTSAIAERYHALAAINGGFFDRKHGGSVNYFEFHDSVISTTRPAKAEWAKPDSLANGALVLMKDLSLRIQPAEPDTFYKNSKQEAAVLVSGPLLIHDSRMMKLPNMAFTDKRHPRTCLCMTRDAVLFVAIDGRGKNAEGMSLYEAQKYLLSVGCVNAINLDGGGSTTLWVKKKGVVNHPSDAAGERDVANAVLLIKK